MNILAVIESGSWIEEHIVGSLRDDGHAVTVFHYGSGVGEFYPSAKREEHARKSSALIDHAQQLKRSPGLDLIFCYVYDDFLTEGTAAALARLDVPLVNYNVDMLTQWYRQTRTARFFTRILCAQRANIQHLARYNPRLLFWPMAARPKLLERQQAFKPAEPVTFLGTPSPYRAAVLKHLQDGGVPLAVYGKFWREQRVATAETGVEKLLHDVRYYSLPKFRAEGIAGLLASLARRFHSGAAAPQLPDAALHGTLPAAALADLFHESAINLGFTRMGSDDPSAPAPTQVKLRDFEVPIAGGFYLVEHVPEYAEHFQDGKEVVTWRTIAELKDKIDHWLARPAERAAIAAAARQRALREHTWSARFAALFADLGVKA